jgi:AraC-like DNA-binding protein
MSIIELPLKPVERVLFQSPLVAIGRFSAGPEHPAFAADPTLLYPHVGFARHALIVEKPHCGRVVASPLFVAMHNVGERFVRRALSAHGDQTDWFAVDPAWLRALLADVVATPAEVPDDALFAAPLQALPASVLMAQRLLVQRIAKQPRLNPVLVEECATDILTALVGGNDPPHMRRAGSRQTRKVAIAQAVEEVLARDYALDFSLTALCSGIGTSPYHAMRAFRAHTGLSIHQYQFQLRARHALDDVLATTLPLAAIAQRNGFFDQSHFSNAFRKVFGQTPACLRVLGCTARTH